MRILILGGTGFIGPWQVRAAVGRGHDVTVFNRGSRSTALPASVEVLHGDRAAADLGALEKREWDAVIDNPVMLPSWVRSIGTALEGRVGHYIFVSTISVYADMSRAGLDERAPTASFEGDPLAVTLAQFRSNAGEMYGPLKAAAEAEAERCFAGHTAIIRPGLIVGPGDPTDRFTYWPVRVARGGEVLAPGTPADPVQVIDARDLAEWTIRVAEQRMTGTFNATGRSTPIGEMFEAMRPLAREPVRFTFVDADFLERHGVQPWSDMPAWFPPRGEMGGLGRVSIDRALAAGLTLRPLADTARDTLDWFESAPSGGRTPNAGISAEREREVLAAWHARGS